MTADQIKSEKEILENAYNAAIATDNDYRNAKAHKFLQLACPTDGSKKPTESTILALIDADPVIADKRMARDLAAAKLDIAKMTFKAYTFSNEQ